MDLPQLRRPVVVAPMAGVRSRSGLPPVDDAPVDDAGPPMKRVFDIPSDLAKYLEQLDAFIEREIQPLQDQDDNNRFFDHRREHSRTDWDNDGLPREEWEDLLIECARRADKAGFWRFSLPKEFRPS